MLMGSWKGPIAQKLVLSTKLVLTLQLFNSHNFPTVSLNFLSSYLLQRALQFVFGSHLLASILQLFMGYIVMFINFYP